MVRQEQTSDIEVNLQMGRIATETEEEQAAKAVSVAPDTIEDTNSETTKQFNSTSYEVFFTKQIRCEHNIQMIQKSFCMKISNQSHYGTLRLQSVFRHFPSFITHNLTHEISFFASYLDGEIIDTSQFFVGSVLWELFIRLNKGVGCP